MSNCFTNVVHLNVTAYNGVPSSAEVFRVIKDDDLESLQRLFACGSASLWDCDEMGRSLLLVSHFIGYLERANGVSMPVSVLVLGVALFFSITAQMWLGLSWICSMTGKSSCSVERYERTRNILWYLSVYSWRQPVMVRNDYTTPLYCLLSHEWTRTRRLASVIQMSLSCAKIWLRSGADPKISRDDTGHSPLMVSFGNYNGSRSDKSMIVSVFAR